MNRIQLQSDTSTDNILVQWLRCLRAKQVIWVQSLVRSVIFCKFYFVKFIYLDENYEKFRIMFSLKTIELLENVLQPHFGSTPLF